MSHSLSYIFVCFVVSTVFGLISSNFTHVYKCLIYLLTFLSSLHLVVLGIVLSLRFHRLRGARSLRGVGVHEGGEQAGVVGVKGGRTKGSKRAAMTTTSRDEDIVNVTVMELLEPSLRKDQTTLQRKGRNVLLWKF